MQASPAQAENVRAALLRPNTVDFEQLAKSLSAPRPSTSVQDYLDAAYAASHRKSPRERGHKSDQDEEMPDASAAPPTEVKTEALSESDALVAAPAPSSQTGALPAHQSPPPSLPQEASGSHPIGATTQDQAQASEPGEAPLAQQDGSKVPMEHLTDPGQIKERLLLIR